MSNLKLVETEQLAFDYAALPSATATEARQAAERIRLRLRRTAEDIIEIGRDLLAQKEALPHGSFTVWVDAEFGMSDKTAQKMMQVARHYGSKPELGSVLDVSALYELSAPKTPLEVREEIERMIEARAKIRLAEEYNAAQERGEVAGRGGERSGLEHSPALPTASDVGLSRKEIHEGRELLKAEEADPGDLSKSQRAMAVAKAFPESASRKGISNIPDCLSKQLVSQARTVARLSPDLVELVLAGTMTVMDAYKQASLRKSDKDKQIDRLNKLAKASPEAADAMLESWAVCSNNHLCGTVKMPIVGANNYLGETVRV
ncbi:DUF3102 domain-containing protein [Mesorhizobium sp. GR13]|uniref:DUF3102 domain-containing protein n=1 Tax=Mesorhizobium sp. GR13 TaxID=2562308 RepID=UPI0010C040A2|nr:DUF3102 domain-containing protein [Mesorhizobium sp. GR13]